MWVNPAQTNLRTSPCTVGVMEAGAGSSSRVYSSWLKGYLGRKWVMLIQNMQKMYVYKHARILYVVIFLFNTGPQCHLMHVHILCSPVSEQVHNAKSDTDTRMLCQKHQTPNHTTVTLRYPALLSCPQLSTITANKAAKSSIFRFFRMTWPRLELWSNNNHGCMAFDYEWAYKLWPNFLILLDNNC